MKKIMLSTIAIMCLTGLGSLSFAEEMGKMKGEMMKGEMKEEKDKMKSEVKGKHDEMKAKHDAMKGDMKAHKDAMKGEMKGAMGK